ncbi:tRNA lysidine(34) synthetase TilS [Patiriisocius marinus]|uniref:tRNA(Ile)-lysidine synthase n=1 Tax=Patiriisocius marinus TaxID=1397112 RepID=A0A5J4J017_9FLAO|nr:tRNA lysidine(34) synthetase TilS [Patiriisocius marinus]GER59420.1 tRNA(Ile)-lysidine synthase [Patiriisocius marinus]
MINQFQSHLSKTFPDLKNQKILLAFSGGLDSTVLLTLLHQLGYNVAAAHCNFSLRNMESDEDEIFVKTYCKKLGIPIYIETFDTKTFANDQKQSTQMAARTLRYTWFEELMEKESFDVLATAHHADDDLETFLINLSRGTGLRGLIGIPETNNRIIRPLLPFSRAEILSWAKIEQLHWREDSSNSSRAYTRNQLRLDVIPNLKKSKKRFLESFKTTKEHLIKSQALVEDYLSLVYNLIITQREDGYQISIDKLKELPNTEALLYELLAPFGFTDHKAVLDILNAQAGKYVISPSHRLLKDRNSLILTENVIKEPNKCHWIKKNQKNINNPLNISLTPTNKMGLTNLSTIYVDSEYLTFPLCVRKWQQGDVFQPFGMKGNKKLSKFFKDEKLSLAAKEALWILTSDDKIVWVIGYRADDRFKVSEKTKSILKIKISE